MCRQRRSNEGDSEWPELVLAERPGLRSGCFQMDRPAGALSWSPDLHVLLFPYPDPDTITKHMCSLLFPVQSLTLVPSFSLSLSLSLPFSFFALAISLS